MLEELRVAGDLLRLALDRYLSACLAIKRCSAGYSRLAGQPQLACPTSRMVLDEVSLLGEHETKLRESKTALHQIVNLYPDVVPVSRLPIDILVRIFTQLTVEEYEHALSDVQKTAISKYPMTLSHVCSNWRHIVIQSPLLWSYITIVSSMENQQRFAYVDLHSKHSKEALVNISIDTRAPETSLSTISIDPFLGRIRSLRLQWPPYSSQSIADRKMGASHLITRCLRASNGALKQFTLHMSAMAKQCPFMESVSHPVNRNSLLLGLPHDQLEYVLSTVANISLRGHYFNWESKAYHGLTTLQLGMAGPQSIPELQLAKILASSPRLQYIDIALKIIRDATSPPPVHLPGLEVLTGSVLLLQLIWPGPKELSVNIIGQWKYGHDSSMLYNARLQDFFSRANTARLLIDEWLFSTSEICHIVTMSPGIRALALSCTKLSGTLPDMLKHPSLEALYLLSECELERSLLIDMTNKWNIKKLLFWGENSIIRGSSYEIDSQQSLEEELSDLRDTRLEFIPCSNEDASLVDFFASQL
ncbi:unnamed protein product [Rhizoctonia solani]|uniref:F-box domain-containing protein n=1 Tax=Rhizoctonia solani TaxID=456999 RepID=A0A8H3GXF0_9AGAM|nr:unnamed protein product [Rhizoctonia solani]